MYLVNRASKRPLSQLVEKLALFAGITSIDDFDFDLAYKNCVALIERTVEEAQRRKLLCIHGGKISKSASFQKSWDSINITRTVVPEISWTVRRGEFMERHETYGSGKFIGIKFKITAH